MTNRILNEIAVIKFGSSVLANEADIHQAIHEVYGYLRKNNKVIVVVSAMGQKTNELDYMRRRLFCDEITGDARAYAELLATGEMATTSLFLMGLIEVGIPAAKLNYHCLQTKGPLLDATPVHLDKNHVLTLLENHSVVVIPGFLGIDSDSGATSLLGRGGSDFTAIFLAAALNADACVLYKDTDGIYNDDPTIVSHAKRYETINYDDCLKLSYPVIQHKALHFAKKNALKFIVKSINGYHQTEVKQATTSIDINLMRTLQPMKVALLGLGTVGLGVYQYLTHAPQLFEIVGIGIKHPEKVRASFITHSLLTKDLHSLINQSDIIVDVTGETKLGFDLVSLALKHKRHVITANKFLIGQYGEKLLKLAGQHSQLLYSATVGGGIPILEVLNYLKKHSTKNKIQSVYGILNGTSNFILEKVSQGESFDEAIKLAQLAGYAESDTNLDLNGLDAAQKLIIIGKLLFNLQIKDLQVCPLKKDTLTKTKDKVLKQVAQCELINDNLHASVQQLAVPLTHPFAKITGADNCIFIKTIEGEVAFLKGKGAGRWPTALSVFADLLTIHSQHVAEQHEEVADHSLLLKEFRGFHHETLDATCTY